MTFTNTLNYIHITDGYYLDKIYIKISGRCRLVVPQVGARDVRPVPHVSKLCEGRPAHTTQSKLTVPHLPACHLVVECHTLLGCARAVDVKMGRLLLQGHRERCLGSVVPSVAYTTRSHLCL